MDKTLREEMINDLIETVWDWEIDSLVYFAQERIKEYYESLDDETLTEEWHDWFDIE